MNNTIKALLVVMAVSVSLAFVTPWGFYGHRLINRLAVFTMPAPIAGFYKQHIDYISAHAVDPDKRRYATKHEGVRHYIDIDVWGDNPFEEVPRDIADALIKYGDFQLISETDSVLLETSIERDTVHMYWPDGELIGHIKYRDFRAMFYHHFMPMRYEDDWVISNAGLPYIFLVIANETEYDQVRFIDNFSEMGILPYHLVSMQRRLTEAFTDRDMTKVLRLSAEYGHYIGDAHVPLHTTVNYNGQLTDQVGIHAFWESRIPELFAEEEYDFLVGGAEYVDDVKTYVWDIVEASHNELDSVLLIEKELSRTFPEDRQYCYDERLSRTIRIQCPEYAAAYQDRMGGMVERRMRESIKAIGDLWYTAWVDGGQPAVSELKPGGVIEAEDFQPMSDLKGVRRHDF